MNSNWQRLKISDLGTVVSGGTPSTKNSDNWDGKVSWITPKDLSGYLERYISKGERNITDKGLRSSSAKLLPKGTVLFSSRAPIGYVAIAEKELCTNQGFKNIVPNSENHNIFIFYLLRYLTDDIKNVAGGSTFSEISGTALKNINIYIPKLAEQKSIANILSSLDDKIELNNKINKNLEEIAQTLYKRWFVDFEFSDENGNPYKSSGGKMIESELGLIPKGWKIVEFKEIFDYQNGFPFKSNEYVESGRYNVITIRNVKDGNLDLSNVSKIDYLPEKLNPEQKLEIGDILISLTGNVGRVCLVSIDNGLLNQRVAKIKNYEYKGFTYFMLRNNNIFNEIVSLGKGSAQQNLSPVEMSKIKLAFPVKENLNIPIFDDYLNMILKNSQENIKLVEMRDLLLPKLMSGEIRLPVEE